MFYITILNLNKFVLILNWLKLFLIKFGKKINRNNNFSLKLIFFFYFLLIFNKSQWFYLLENNYFYLCFLLVFCFKQYLLIFIINLLEGKKITNNIMQSIKKNTNDFVLKSIIE